MRRLHRTYATAAGLLALALCVTEPGTAQTTFASSNNPAASLSVQQQNKEATVVHVSQTRTSVSYVPLSQNTVLRDPQTGISYPLQGLDVEIERATLTEHYTLRFAPFIDVVGYVELLDPTNVNGALYFKAIDLGVNLTAGRSPEE